jgi:hypothetical protein
MRDQVGQLGKSGEYRMGRSEAGLHDIRSSDGSPRLCRLRTALVGPPATSIELCTDAYGHQTPQKLNSSMVVELDENLPRFMDV